jgi:RNA polymerase sigma-70 factor (ECF subfamily)
VALSEGALYACYQRMEKPLYNVLYRWLWQPQECQDVIHDAFLRMWARRNRVDEARLERLVWTTALNLARNRLRWRSLWRFVELPTDSVADDSPDDRASRAQSDERVRAALAALPHRMRQVLLLSEFGGLGVAEIASVLAIPAGTVGSRKFQALAKLRSMLQEDGP